MTLTNYTKYYSIGKFLGKLGTSTKASGLNTALGIGGAAVGLASGLIGFNRSINDKSKFIVVFESSNGPQKQNVSANDKIEAKHKIQSRFGGTNHKVFHNPQENDAALEYFESLESQSNN